jgi:lysozyme family protein
MTVFAQAFAVVVGHEGGFSAERADPGNWTGGAVGRGDLHGTKFGISAAAYPEEDIAALTLEAAAAIYQRDYWEPVGGDRLPPPLALLVFDAAVNNGVARAASWLQMAVGASVDGCIGPATLAAVDAVLHSRGGAAVCAEFQTQRLLFMDGLPTWRVFGVGWARRLNMLPYQAITMAAESGPDRPTVAAPSVTPLDHRG